jgi:hypothetical protein
LRHSGNPFASPVLALLNPADAARRRLPGMFRLLGGAIGIIFLIGLLVIIGLLTLIF